jgi:hypothetical protein
MPRELAQRLPRIVAVFDEFSTACDQDNRARGELVQRVCFQVARREISRSVVYRPGAELTLAPHCVPWHCPPGQVWCSAGVARPGHGLTMDGRLQAYYLDKQS